MSENEKKILKTFGELIPKLTETEKEKLLSFGEGMVFMKNTQNCDIDGARQASSIQR